MNYAKIYTNDLANGLGVRVSLFVSGCTHHCKGCFNKEVWNFNYGKSYTQKTEDKLIDLLKSNYIKGISLLGGDPMMEQNRKDILSLCKRIKKELPEKDIWLWTGYTLKQLKKLNCPVISEILEQIDILIDGRFEEDLKDRNLKFRGSSNQKIYKRKRKDFFINITEAIENERDV